MYRDNALVTAAFRGNDLVTLVVAVPVLVAAALLSMRGSERARLVWLGALGYVLYNYVFYLYGAAFNGFFLIYTALVPLSVLALVLGLAQTDVREVARSFREGTPVGLIGGWMLFFGTLLGGMWVAFSLSFVVTGRVPEPILQTDHPAGVVLATDLSLLVPGLLLGGLLLRRRRPWGYVIGALVLVKACAYGPALIAMSAFSAAAGEGGDPFLPLWAFLTAGCLVACGSLLGNMRSADGRADHPRGDDAPQRRAGAPEEGRGSRV